jgi:hypothetical protein
MDHKLQVSSFTNDGSKTVGRDTNSHSTSEIASNDAGPEQGLAADLAAEAVSVRDSQLADVAGFGAKNQPLGGGGGLTENPTEPIISTEAPPAHVAQGQDTRQVLSASSAPRCEVARSAGYDPTGEHAVACGALAQVVCEYCGPMCWSCAEETFCLQGEHKLASLPDDGPLPSPRQRKGPISEVVYVEIKCPNCRRVRLALPKKHRPKAVRKCPICKTKAPAEYLAHGFTRRRLPYHEVFTEEKELPEGVEFKRRTPWDRRPNWWVEE